MENKCHLMVRAACAALAILSCAAQASATTSQAAHGAADVRPADGNGGKPRVNWNEYLSIMEQPAPKTGVRRFRLDGIPQKVYYDAQSPLERGSGCSLAVVVIHGWGGGFIRSRSQETLIDEFRKMKCFGEDVPYVIAPLFPRDDLAEKKFGKVEGLATWNRSWSKDFRVNLAVPGKAEDDWRGGGEPCFRETADA